jgi:hypothetical protein
VDNRYFRLFHQALTVRLILFKPMLLSALSDRDNSAVLHAAVDNGPVVRKRSTGLLAITG